MNRLKNIAKEFVKNEDGANIIEYIAIVAAVLGIGYVALRGLGSSTKNKYDAINNEFSKTN